MRAIYFLFQIPRLGDWLSRSDSELIEELKGGQAMALAVLYDRYAGLVYGLALRITANAGEAEDVTKEVFVTLWQNPTSYDGWWGSLSSFLSQLTRSRALKRLHGKASKLGNWESCPPFFSAKTRTTAPFEQLSVEERRQQVQEALSQLPEKQRQILELCYYRGLSLADIAHYLRIPLETVQAYSHQALVKWCGSLRPLLP